MKPKYYMSPTKYIVLPNLGNTMWLMDSEEKGRGSWGKNYGGGGDWEEGSEQDVN
jgi:hypothetical protein